MKLFFTIWNVLIRLISGFLPFKQARQNLRKYGIFTSFCPKGVNFYYFENGKNTKSNFIPFGLKVSCFGSNNKIIVDKSADIKKMDITIRANNSICIIGKNSTIIESKIFLYGSNNVISIGNDCMFSYDIELWCGDGHAIFNCTDTKPYNIGENIIIGNHVWVGAHTKILKGTNIPNNSIIGMQSLVKGNYTEKNSIIAGIPATTVKKNIYWDRREPEFFNQNI